MGKQLFQSVTVSLSPRTIYWIMAAISFSAVLGGVALSSLLNISPLRPDTASYLYFDPSRSIGYPVFLSILRTVTGSAQLAVYLQMAILAGSIFLLAASFHRLVGRVWLSIPFQLLALSSPEMWIAAASLITEALATAMVALWCAQLLRMVRGASLKSILLLCLLALLATLVRPSLVALFVANFLLCFALLDRAERWRGAGLTVAALVITIAITPVSNLLLHGSTESGSPVARGLLQHTLYCPPATPPSGADAAFVEQHAARVRQYIATAPKDVQPVLKQLYSGELRFGLIIPAIGRRHGLDAGWQTDPILMTIATERVAANPWCYAASVLRSYRRMATYQTTGTRAEVDHIKKFLAANPPVQVAAVPLLPTEERLAVRAAREFGEAEPPRPGRQLYDPPKVKPLLLMIAAPLIYGTAALAGLIALLAVPFWTRLDGSVSRIVAAMAAAGAAFHGVLAITALVELPLNRYGVPVFPVVCTQLGLLSLIFLRRRLSAR